MGKWSDTTRDGSGIVPEQQDRRERGPGGPERTLMAAVLEDAVDLCRKYGHLRQGPGAAHVADVRRWVASQDRTWPFSFLNVCDWLDVSPDYVRRRIRALLEPGNAPEPRRAPPAPGVGPSPVQRAEGS